MKKFFLLPALLIVITMGLFIRERMVLSSLEQDVRDKTTALHSGYSETVSLHLPVVQELATGDMAVTEAASQVQTLAVPLEETADIAANVAALNNLQIAIRDLVVAGRANEALTEHPSYITLQTEVSERSRLRPLVNEFNAAARYWNDRRESRIGAVMVNIMDTETERLPYLRFDGETETETTISL